MNTKPSKLQELQKNENSSNIVHQTLNNVTYVSVNSEFDKQKPVIQQHFQKQKSHTITTEDRYTSNTSMPYCPPPDYSISSESQDDFNVVKKENAKKNAQIGQFQRTRNAGGSLQYHRPIHSENLHNSNSNNRNANNVYHLQGSDIPYSHEQYFTQSYYPSEQSYDQSRHYSNSRHPVGSTTSQPLNAHHSNYNSGPKYYPGDTYSGNNVRYDNQMFHSAHHSHPANQSNDARWYYDYAVEDNDSSRWSSLPPNKYYSSVKTGNTSHQHYSHISSQRNRSPPPPPPPAQSSSSSMYYHTQSPNNNTTIIRRF